MNSLILYYAHTNEKSKIPNEYRYVQVVPPNQHVGVFIRAEIVEGDIVSALDKASPRQGEIVLNTIPLHE